MQRLAQPPRARDGAEHRNQHHRHARGDRRQVARHDQPDRLRQAEDQHRVVADGGDRRRLRHGPAIALEQRRCHGHRQRRQQRHPEDDRQRRRDDPRAPHLLRAERPDRRRDQHADGGERAAGERLELVPEEERDAEPGTDDSGDVTRLQPLAEDGDAPERREDRHRVAEDRGPSRRQRLNGEDREHVPDEHVGEGEHGELAPIAALDPERDAQPPQHGPEHGQAEPHREGAKGERRIAGDALLHHRPVEAPDDGEKGEQRVLLAAEGERVRVDAVQGRPR